MFLSIGWAEDPDRSRATYVMRYALNFSAAADRLQRRAPARARRRGDGDLRRRGGGRGAVRDRRGRRRPDECARAHQRRRRHRQRAGEPARHRAVPGRRPAAGAARRADPARAVLRRDRRLPDRAVPHAVARRPRRARRRRWPPPCSSAAAGGSASAVLVAARRASRPSATSRSRRPRRRASA